MSFHSYSKKTLLYLPRILLCNCSLFLPLVSSRLFSIPTTDLLSKLSFSYPVASSITPYINPKCIIDTAEYKTNN